MEEKTEFKVEDMETADWCLEKIAEAENEIEKNNAYAEMQMQKIKDWNEDVNKEHKNTIDFMSSHLQRYLMEENVKSIKLINGNIGFRKQQDKWKIEDDAGLVQFLEDTELHDLVRVKKTPALSEMKKHLSVVGNQVVYEMTGEVIEGITIEEQPDKFTFKTK